MDDENINSQFPRLILVTDWNKYFDYPTIGALRNLIFYKDKNGFSKVIRKINSRILVNVQAYYNWVEEINGMTNP